jgi:hypothetical protein
MFFLCSDHEGGGDKSSSKAPVALQETEESSPNEEAKVN